MSIEKSEKSEKSNNQLEEGEESYYDEDPSDSKR
jgi:hypothetical protein